MKKISLTRINFVSDIKNLLSKALFVCVSEKKISLEEKTLKFCDWLDCQLQNKLPGDVMEKYFPPHCFSALINKNFEQAI